MQGTLCISVLSKLRVRRERSAESLRRGEEFCFSLSLSSFLTLRSLNSESRTDSLDSLKMSTSTTHQGLGECVVCGKASSTRCSKCNSAGLDWMFFCGQEHQKLLSLALLRLMDRLLTRLLEVIRSGLLTNEFAEQIPSNGPRTVEQKQKSFSGSFVPRYISQETRKRTCSTEIVKNTLIECTQPTRSSKWDTR